MHPRGAGILATTLILVCLLSTAQAQSEAYSLSLSKQLLREGDSVVASLNVISAQPSTYYEFLFSVVDSTDTLYLSTGSYTTGPSETAFTISRTFPSDFPSPASTGYVGRYTIYVDEVFPGNRPFVQSSTFDVSLTEKSTYQRTETVNIIATGYAPGETVTFNLKMSGTPLPGFPFQMTSNPSGLASYSWYAPASSSPGTYDLSITGTSTAKTVPDSQSFTVTPARLVLLDFSPANAYLERTRTLTVSFRAVYPNGGTVTTGLGVVSIFRPDGSSPPQVSSSYNSSEGRITFQVATSKDEQTGPWRAILNPGSFDDSYGNTGPSSIITIQFTVQAANLSIVLTLSSTSVSSSQSLTLTATITYPDGTPMAVGTVSAQLSLQNGPDVAEMPFRYNQPTLSWIGYYTPRQGDPKGTWTVSFSALDFATPANHGQESTMLSFTGSDEAFLATNLLIGTIAAIAIAAAATILWARRKVTRREVKLDLKFVDAETEKIQEKDFFKNIKEQLDEKKKRVKKPE